MEKLFNKSLTNQFAKVVIDTSSNRFYVVQAGKQIGWYKAASIAYAKANELNAKL